MGSQSTEPPLGDSFPRMGQPLLSSPSLWWGLVLGLLTELWQRCGAPGLPKPFLFNGSPAGALKASLKTPDLQITDFILCSPRITHPGVALTTSAA